MSDQVDDAGVADVGLARVGVVAHHGADVVPADARSHLGAELLIDVIDADFPQLVAGFATGKYLFCAQIGI